MLGFGPCYHMVNVLADLDLAPRWLDAVNGNADWEAIFGEHQSTVDWPGSYFTKELIEVYPDAKVLLSTRAGDSWARSMRDTIWGLFYDDILIRDLSEARAKVDPKWADYLEMMKTMWRNSGLISDGADTTPEAMAEAAERYQEDIKRAVPPDRLLAWSVEEGWEPLCEFLGVPVPDTPFPHLNDSQGFVERIVDGSLQVLQAWRASQQQPAAVTG
jgi:hypothetical protein